MEVECGGLAMKTALMRFSLWKPTRNSSTSVTLAAWYRRKLCAYTCRGRGVVNTALITKMKWDWSA